MEHHNTRYELCDVRVRLRDYIATFRCHHHSVSDLACGGVLDRLQEAPGDTRSAFDAWAVVVIPVIVRGAVLDPVS